MDEPDAVNGVSLGILANEDELLGSFIGLLLECMEYTAQILAGVAVGK
jgi:hypothetical protein